MISDRKYADCHSPHIFVYRKPLARRVVQKKAFADDVERKTPPKAVKNKDNGKGANSRKTVKRKREWLGKKEGK